MPRTDPDRPSRRRRAIGALLCAAVAMLLVAGCGGDDDDDGEEASQTIDVIAEGSKPVDVDLGEGGPTSGDLNVFDTKLEFADGGDPAGRLYGVQTSVSLEGKSEIVQGMLTYDLPEGQITAGGLSEYPSGGGTIVEEQGFERSIIGGTGTGAYAGASGTVTTTLRSDGRYEHELSLQG